MAFVDNELGALRKRADDLEAENARLKQERDAQTERARLLQVQVEKQDAEIRELNRRIAVLEAEKSALERLFEKLEVVRVQVSEAHPPAPLEITGDVTVHAAPEPKASDDG